MTQKQIERFNEKVFERKTFMCKGKKVIPLKSGFVKINEQIMSNEKAKEIL